MLYKDVKRLQWEHGGVYVEKCQGDAWKEDLAGRVKKKKKDLETLLWCSVGVSV